MTTDNGTATQESLELGAGYLGWPIGERQSGRFGHVHLSHSAHGGDYVRFDASLHGPYGELWAVVVAPRAPIHHLDQVAAAGEQVWLGTGYLQVYPPQGHAPSLVGIWPDGKAEGDEGWMDETALYRVDDSLVTLVFVPSP